MLPTMSFRLVHDVMVLVHGETEPRDDEWANYIAVVKVAIAKRAVRVLLVLSRGGGPNAKQRARIVEAYQGSNVYAAICTSSAVARGVTTAIGWIYKANLMRSFPSGQLNEAMTHLGIPTGLQSTVRATIHGLEGAIGGSTSHSKRAGFAMQPPLSRGS